MPQRVFLPPSFFFSLSDSLHKHSAKAACLQEGCVTCDWCGDLLRVFVSPLRIALIYRARCGRRGVCPVSSYLTKSVECVLWVKLRSVVGDCLKGNLNNVLKGT